MKSLVVWMVVGLVCSFGGFASAGVFLEGESIALKVGDFEHSFKFEESTREAKILFNYLALVPTDRKCYERKTTTHRSHRGKGMFAPERTSTYLVSRDCDPEWWPRYTSFDLKGLVFDGDKHIVYIDEKSGKSTICANVLQHETGQDIENTSACKVYPVRAEDGVSHVVFEVE